MSQNLFSSLYSSGNPFTLIDTRERRDHVNGHWFGSTNIPLSVLKPQITLLACTLKAAGYSGPYVIFKGGTQAWQLDGLEREFNANRLFAKESNSAKPVIDFLNMWNIKFTQVDKTSLEALVAKHTSHHFFDVSDDASTGQLASHNIIRISGTNLIQQTDRLIARYHVPVILLDHGSGSRAAFAAYWLQAMGYSVSVVYMADELASLSCQNQHLKKLESHYPIFSIEQLLKYKSTSGKIFDFRSSKSFSQCHLTESHWQNISELIAGDDPVKECIVLIGNNITHASNTANLLEQHGWNVAGLYCWESGEIDPTQIQTGVLDSPIDQSALFSGRHHGNMQDSRDYLAWEEALPEQIDQVLHQTWLTLLDKTAD